MHKSEAVQPTTEDEETDMDTTTVNDTETQETPEVIAAEVFRSKGLSLSAQTGHTLAKLAIAAGLSIGVIGGTAFGAGADTPPHAGPGLQLDNGGADPEPEPEPGVNDVIVAAPTEPEPDPGPQPDELDITAPPAQADPDPIDDITAPEQDPGPGDGPDDKAPPPPATDDCADTTICDLTDRPSQEPDCDVAGSCPEDTPVDTPDTATPENQGSPVGTPDASTPESDQLAFTGAGTVILAILGSGLTGLGVALRRFARRTVG